MRFFTQNPLSWSNGNILFNYEYFKSNIVCVAIQLHSQNTKSSRFIPVNKSESPCCQIEAAMIFIAQHSFDWIHGTILIDYGHCHGLLVCSQRQLLLLAFKR